MNERKIISILTPTYNEEESIPSVYARVKSVMGSLGSRYDYEHVFTDNASSDNSFSILKSISEKDTHVKAIRLSRNFGVTKNVLNGLYRCRGDAVIQIDADLQDPPEMIPEFIKKWEDGYKVVYGVRADRDEFWLMKTIRKLYYRIASKLATDTLLHDVGEFRLLDKRIIEELKKYEDYTPYLRGIIANLGFKQIGIPYRRDRREKGRSSHNLFSLIDYGLNGIISHSRTLVRLSTIVGFLTALISFAAAVIFAILKIITPNVPAGVTTIIIFVLFFAGLQMIFLGVIGEYIAKIFDQSIKKPLVIEEELIGFESQNESQRFWTTMSE